MSVHIGKLIREQLKVVGMNKAEFARRINCTSQNVYDIFKRQSVDTKLLTQIGAVLSYNFFQFYVVKDEKIKPIPEKKTRFTGSKQVAQLKKKIKELEHNLEICKKEKEAMAKEILYLKEVNELLKERKTKKQP